MKLKVCGMNHNPEEVAQLHPDYMGFIFWEPSSRFFEGEMPALPKSVKKVGVFVDATVEEVLEKVQKFDLAAVQLHGNESSEFCSTLEKRHSELVSESHANGSLNQVHGDKKRPSVISTERGKSLEIPQSQSSFRNDKIDIIKVFSIKDDFDFSILKDYEEVCDYYLFDTKGKLPGGNGYTFDWSVLNNYPSTKPYFLSGGIGLESASKLKAFLESPASKYCKVIDVNSKFEIKPGLKDIEQLKEFKKLLTNKHQQ
ncbi:phosphoribosylanthranilate isomerase [Flagellimonas sp.]|uniref:phosphoribosylanthranilate isomerase n=1 Tax=Flagellimonas sp. TaxID=2058762 RepID=UPI003B50209C